MNLIEANIILNILVFLYQYLFCSHIYLLGSFTEDFSYSVRIHESILMSYFTRYLQRLVKFWQRRKKWEVNSAPKLREQSGFKVSRKYCLNLSCLRRLKVGLSPSKKNLFFWLHWKPFNNDGKCFLFHLKSSFGSQDI